MAVTNELNALLRACKALDNPNITAEQIESIAQLARTLALSFNARVSVDGFFVEGVASEWPDPVRLSYVLAVRTMLYAESLSWPEGGTPDMRDWWGNYKKDVRSEWCAARRDAEELADPTGDDITGAVQPAETPLTEDAIVDAIKSLIPPDAGPSVVIV
jgi:hypothetical protein